MKDLKIIMPVLIVLLMCFWAVAALAENEDGVLGFWRDTTHQAIFEIYKCGEKYCGRVVAAKDLPIVDEKNPDPALRDRPIIGLDLLNGFSYKGKKWSGGQIYDPETGVTYVGQMSLKDPNTLKLRGKAKGTFFSKTITLRRVAGPGLENN